ncbi:MAG: sugar transferase, partial [Anaerolineales bacterium]|nr:sugar transferase [Anaerolineales bacterium]
MSSVYDPKRNYRVVDELQTLTISIGFAALVCMGILYVGYRNVSRWLFVTFVLLDVIFLISWRLTIRSFFRIFTSIPDERRVLIVGAGQVGNRVVDMIREYSSAGIELVGFVSSKQEAVNTEGELPLLGRTKDVKRIIREKQVDDVVIALPHQANKELGKLVWELHDIPVNVRVVPDYFSLALYRATAEEFAGVPMINLRDPALNDVQRFAKRFFDIVLSLILILLAMPVMIVVAIAIKLDSPAGPIFFRQQRVGENGRLFGMFKFRSMVPNAEELQEKINQVDENGNLVFKFKNDPR